jgi:hypothetical protein
VTEADAVVVLVDVFILETLLLPRLLTQANGVETDAAEAREYPKAKKKTE